MCTKRLSRTCAVYVLDNFDVRNLMPVIAQTKKKIKKEELKGNNTYDYILEKKIGNITLYY